MGLKALCVAGVCSLCLFAASDQPGRAEPIALASATSPADPSAQPPDPSQGVVYICPMDPDVRSHNAGVCRRCGMRLGSGIPDPVEFHLEMSVFTETPLPGRTPVLQSTRQMGRFGHESGFAPDGNTFYATSISTGDVAAVDVTDPTQPEVVWEGKRWPCLGRSPNGR